WEQQFSSTFHGDEFFLTNHVIAGQCIMPGVAYLEMARAAVREALGADAMPEPGNLDLSHVVWVRSLIVSEHPVTVHITLTPQEDGTIAFVIQRNTAGAGSPVSSEEETAERIYCQGKAQWHTENTTRSTVSFDLD